MNIEIKAGGAMVQFLPAGNTGSTCELTVENEAASVQHILDSLSIPEDQPLMIILNGAMVQRPDYGSTLLGDGDKLSLMPPIQAG